MVTCSPGKQLIAAKAYKRQFSSVPNFPIQTKPLEWILNRFETLQNFFSSRLLNHNYIQKCLVLHFLCYLYIGSVVIENALKNEGMTSRVF